MFIICLVYRVRVQRLNISLCSMFMICLVYGVRVQRLNISLCSMFIICLVYGVRVQRLNISFCSMFIICLVYGVRVLRLNATFNSISVISWRLSCLQYHSHEETYLLNTFQWEILSISSGDILTHGMLGENLLNKNQLAKGLKVLL